MDTQESDPEGPLQKEQFQQVCPRVVQPPGPDAAVRAVSQQHTL